VDSGLEFEWDPAKADANFRRHGVSFTTAVLVFADPLVRIAEDDRFGYGEIREVAMGAVEADVLVVVYVERVENLIRIISARHATPQERRRYAND
jgi:uncharacterized DUF497 family protein